MATHHEHKAAEGWFDWAYRGVDPTFPGNGGPECRDFLSLNQRCWESIIASIVALIALLVAYPRLRLPKPCPCGYSKKEPLGKRLLLLLMCLTFGIELGFKLATRQMIWIGNPCHLATMMQIFILAAPPSRIVTAAFRLHMHMLTGAPIAILFPVINTRLLPFETGVYFLQHILMLVIPFYLMRTGDPFIPERLGDFSWAMTSFGFLFIYHFLPLQILAYVSQVNLNNMLCPAVSDPFHGKFYRLFAICHQLILIPTLGKLFVVLAKTFNILPCDNPPDDECVAYTLAKDSGFTQTCNRCCSSNISGESLGSSEVNASDCDSGVPCSTSMSNSRGEQMGQSCHTTSYSCGTSYGCGPNTEKSGCTCNSGTSTASSSEEVVASVQHIVNGQMVQACKTRDEGACSRRREVREGGDAAASRDYKGSYQPQSFLIQGARNPEPGNGRDKTLHMSDLEKSRNGHAKTH